MKRLHRDFVATSVIDFGFGPSGLRGVKTELPPLNIVVPTPNFRPFRIGQNPLL